MEPIKEKTADEIMLEHNKMVIEIIKECDYMIKNRHYMNDIAISNVAKRIKDIANHYYIKEPKWENARTTSNK